MFSIRKILVAVIVVGAAFVQPVTPAAESVEAVANSPIVYSIPSTLSSAGIGGLAVKADGTLGYFKAGTGFQKLLPTGTVSTIGGSSVPGIYIPSSVTAAFTAGGNVFVGGSSGSSFSTPSTSNAVVRRESSGATLLTVANANSAVGIGETVDRYLQAVVASPGGTVYALTFESSVADGSGTCTTRLYKLNSTPTFELTRTFVGNVTSVIGEFFFIYDYSNCVSGTNFTVDGSANVYFSDWVDSLRRLRKWSSTNEVSSVTDTDFAGSLLVADASGNLYYLVYSCDGEESCSPVIRRLSTTGVESTLAGAGGTAYSGDGGAATSSNLGNVLNLRTALSGDLYFSIEFSLFDQTRYVVRRIKMNPLLGTASGKQVSIAKFPATSTAADVEIAVKGRAVTTALKTPTKPSGTTGAQREIVSFTVTLQSQKPGVRDVSKSVSTSSGRVVNLSLTGATGGQYTVNVTAYARNGTSSTWVGPKVST